MSKSNMVDINTVCNMLGTTSRTLRFYEEKGIIQSTAVPFQTRRQYSPEQIGQIKNVLVLRSLGLSIATIKALQQGGSLTDAISERKSEVLASIASKTKEIYLLNEALTTVNDGGDLFLANENISPETSREHIELVNICTDALIVGDLTKCFSYFHETLKEYLPLTAFERVVSDTLKPIGHYVYKDRVECDKEFPNVIYSYLKYEKLGLSVKFVIHGYKIQGIWLNYYEPKMER